MVAAGFLIAAAHRIELAPRAPLGEITAVFLQGFVGALGSDRPPSAASTANLDRLP